MGLEKLHNKIDLCGWLLVARKRMSKPDKIIARGVESFATRFAALTNPVAFLAFARG